MGRYVLSSGRTRGLVDNRPEQGVLLSKTLAQRGITTPLQLLILNSTAKTKSRKVEGRWPRRSALVLAPVPIAQDHGNLERLTSSDILVYKWYGVLTKNNQKPSTVT